MTTPAKPNTCGECCLFRPGRVWPQCQLARDDKDLAIKWLFEDPGKDDECAYPDLRQAALEEQLAHIPLKQYEGEQEYAKSKRMAERKG
jgi:hypothetical protein